jgi:hypothetical protein
VLSRINAQLIERHFAVSADTATAFMARLVEEGHFDEIGGGRLALSAASRGAIATIPCYAKAHRKAQG